MIARIRITIAALVIGACTVAFAAAPSHSHGVACSTPGAGGACPLISQPLY